MIPYEGRAAVYKAAIEKYGEGAQVRKAIEEMGELIVELSRVAVPPRTTMDALVDEIADVTIMMEQLRVILGANESVQQRIDYKVRRLATRVGVTEIWEVPHG